MAEKVHQAAEKMKGTIDEAQPSMQDKAEETKDKVQKVKPFVQEKLDEVKSEIKERAEKAKQQTKDQIEKAKPVVQEKADEVEGRVEDQVEKVGAQSKEVAEESKEEVEKEEPMQPFEARGEDPEIDLVATEQAFFHEVKSDQQTGGGPTLGERVSQMLAAAAQMFGEGARKIDPAEEQTK